MKLFKRRQPVEMTEEERRQHELYLQELTKKNKRFARIVAAIIWCVMMASWAYMLVLDVRFEVGPTKILFHGVAAAITALAALPFVLDWLAAKKEAKKEDQDTEA